MGDSKKWSYILYNNSSFTWSNNCVYKFIEFVVDTRVGYIDSTKFVWLWRIERLFT